MIMQIDLNDHLLAETLFALQRISYLVEAELIDYPNLPPLKETFLEFSQCSETFFGFFENKQLIGAISFELEGEVLTICRLVVHPDQFRKGIAKRLLNFVVEQYHDFEMTVSTGKDNLPAKTLYLKSGFQFIGDIEVEPGLFITSFLKKKKHRESQCFYPKTV